MSMAVCYLTDGRNDPSMRRLSIASLRRHCGEGVQVHVLSARGLYEPVCGETLRTIGSEVPGDASPTSGYMAYTILRRKYPAARIHLVNFFGNTRGFQVCARHDPAWEQSVYRRDPLADFLDASTKRG